MRSRCSPSLAVNVYGRDLMLMKLAISVSLDRASDVGKGKVGAEFTLSASVSYTSIDAVLCLNDVTRSTSERSD